LPEEWQESTNVPVYEKGENEFLVIIDAYQFVTYIEHYFQHGAIKVNSLCREYYWGSQV
jgi:hypothetical protein